MSDPDHLFNTVDVTGKNQFGKNAVTDSATWEVDLRYTGVSIEKSGPAIAEVGQTITYTITVHNTGEVDLSITYLWDSLLGDLSGYISDGVITTAEGYEQFTVDYLVPPPGDDPIHNVVTVEAENQFGCNPVDAWDDHDVDITWTWITDTSECRLPITDFRVVFTPDLQNGLFYKISSTNPGSFYFNMLFHACSDTATIDFYISENFTSQGAKWIHAYIWDDKNAPYGSPYTYDGCLDWEELTIDITNGIINYGTSPIGFEDLDPGSNILITMHLQYVLKKTSGYEYPEAKAFNMDRNLFRAEVDECSSYSETILTAHSNPKQLKDPLVYGVAFDETLDETPIEGITFSLYNSKGRCVDSYTTDGYGFYLFDHLKADTYTLEIEIPLNVLVKGLEETTLVLRITMEIKLSNGDYIQVSLFVDNESAAVEGPPGLYTSQSIVDQSIVTNPSTDPFAGDSGSSPESVATSSGLGIPVLIAWLASVLSLAYTFDARQRRKSAKTKSKASYRRSKLEWSVEGLDPEWIDK